MAEQPLHLYNLRHTSMRNIQLDLTHIELGNGPLQLPHGQDPQARGYYHPAFNKIDQYISQFERPKILDLGSSSASSMRHFRGRQAQIRFECLDEFIREALIEGVYRNKPKFLDALERYLDVESDSEKYHVILGWDIFCYLDADSIHLLTGLLRKKCVENSLLHCVRYWQSPFPENPCRYQIVGANKVKSSFDTSVLRHQVKPLNFIELARPIETFELDEQFINQPGMHTAVTEALFFAKPESEIYRKKTLANPFASLNRFGNTDGDIIGDSTEEEQSTPALPVELDHKSSILPTLFSPYLEGDDSRAKGNSTAPIILDLGAHNDINTTFYESLGNKPLFANVRRLLNDNDHAAMTSYMPSLFPTRDSLKFDIVMGWDILFQYPEEDVVKVIDLLRPHISEHTRFHLLRYAPNHQNTEIDHFTLEDSENIQLLPLAKKSNTHMPITVKQLIDILGNAEIAISRRYYPGMLEGTNEYLIGFTGD